MKIVTLYTAAIATTNAAITYQMPVKLRLDTVMCTGYISSSAGNPATYAVELSLQSTGQQTTNDAVGVIAMFRRATNLLAAAAQTASESNLLTPIGFNFAAGDRLYVNVTAANVATAQLTLTLIFN